MDNQEDLSLSPSPSSFESLKKLNDHGIEYWSARDLQPLLGYAKWQRFENALKKAIESCRTSGNNPDHHFTGAGKQIEFGKGATQMVEDYYLSRFA
jgi:DNA-damage-inducible protein D